METAKPPLIYDQSCEQFASLNQVIPQSVRARICRCGSYFGIRPLKLANGRLLFPRVIVSGAEHHAAAAADLQAKRGAQAAEVAALLNGEVA